MLMMKRASQRRAGAGRPRKSGLGIVCRSLLAGCAVAPAAMLLSSCQQSVTVQTHIPALPPGQQREAHYVVSVEHMMPSAQVDAGRATLDPITHRTTVSGGMATYEAKCASCHGQIDPKTSKPVAGQALAPGVPDLADPEFAWTKTPQDMFVDLLTSRAHNEQAHLSQSLDRQSLWNALYFTWTFHTSLNDIIQGGITFGKYCSVCHGTKGRGDGNLADELNPSPRAFIDFAWMVDKTDQRLYISISDGRPPSAMPAWKEALSPTQRIQIINYLRQFTYRHPEDITKKMAEQPPAT